MEADRFMAMYSRITLRWGLDVLWQSLEIVSEFFKLCVRHVFCQAAAMNTISFHPTHNPLHDATRRLTTLQVCVVSTVSASYIDWAGLCNTVWLKIPGEPPSCYSLTFLDLNSSHWKLCSLTFPHNANCTYMRRLYSVNSSITITSVVSRLWTAAETDTVN